MAFESLSTRTNRVSAVAPAAPSPDDDLLLLLAYNTPTARVESADAWEEFGENTEDESRLTELNVSPSKKATQR